MQDYDAFIELLLNQVRDAITAELHTGDTVCIDFSKIPQLSMTLPNAHNPATHTPDLQQLAEQALKPQCQWIHHHCPHCGKPV